MIHRIDRLQTELPPPSDPDPNGAAAVQELLGGRFGEMSTLMNYTMQSFNFRGRQKARPFYDLVANIAAEEYGHIELGRRDDQHDADRRDARGRPGARRRARGAAGRAQHAALPGRRTGRPPPGFDGAAVDGDYVFASGDLVEDLTHNFSSRPGPATTS